MNIIKQRGYIDGFEILIWTLIAAMVVLLVLSVIGGFKAYEKFMTDCLADGRKQYECTAMWRAGNSQVVPMPIVVPVR